MDPNATWARLCEAWDNREYAEAWSAYADLHGWMLNGGFPPAAIKSLGRNATRMVAMVGEAICNEADQLGIAV